METRKVILKIDCVDLLSAWTHKETHQFQLAANQTTELLKISCPSPASSDGRTTASHSVVVAVRLLDAESGELLSRLSDWPQPFRYVDFPDPGLKITVDGDKLEVEVTKPLKALVLSADGEGDEVNWSDNALDVMPGDKQFVTAKGLNGRGLKYSHMGKELAVKV